MVAFLCRPGLVVKWMATELGSFIFIFHPHEVREANDSTYPPQAGSLQ